MPSAFALNRRAALALLALFLPQGCGPESGAGVPRPGRIILVSMDTVRADHVSGYGSATTTPILREIASEGVLFRNFYAASNYTIPSTMSILTGLDAAEHGVHRDVARLAPGVSTLAEALAAAGYRTHAFHEGGYVDARFGFARGFGAYELHARVSLVRDALPEVLEWIREARTDRYFLLLHTYAAHFPYGGFSRYRRDHPERGLPSDADVRELRRRYPTRRLRSGQAPPEIPTEIRAVCTIYNQLTSAHARMLGCGDNLLPRSFPETPHFRADREAIVKSYDERIALIDRALRRIRETLIELDQWDDTLLVVVSDHGEAFFEHKLQRHDF
ncbi:MAG: sulfatase-like hydrolase/transferase, partial [Planctomycetota bacterium]